MLFRDIQLVNGGKYSNEKLEQNRYLMGYWENVRDIFCIFLPDKFDLMGMSKLNIMLGSFDGEEYLPPSSNGIATFRRNDFSFNEFCELSEQAKDLKSLYYIEDSLVKVCRKLKASDETLTVLKSVAKEVQKSNFVLHRVHKKTTKWNKSRNLRAVTNLQHKKGGIDVEVVISDKQGSILFSQQIVTNQFWHSVWFDFFKGGWDGSTFVIRSRVERETLVFDASEFQVT